MPQERSAPQEKNILGTMPIRPLVLTMSCPVMLSMLIQAVYNLVDSICVAQVDDQAFLALSYALPVQMLQIAICVGTGVGFNAILARRMGQRRYDEVNGVVFHGFALFLLNWAVFCLFGLLGTGFFFRLSTDNERVVAYGIQYLTICCCFSFGQCMQFASERVLQSAGHPIGYMLVQGSGALINIILDPIFIFVFQWKVVGAAAATVLGQFVGAGIGFYLVWRIRGELSLNFKGVRPQPELVREIYRIGAPAIVMQSLASFMILGLNQMLTRWSETAVWVLGVYFKLQNFVFMPVFGINNGLVSVLSYNYGARGRERIQGGIQFGLQLAVGIMGVGTVLVWLLSRPLLLYCFHATAPALEMGVPALRMVACSFLFAGVTIIFNSAFQSLGYGTWSLGLALLRQIVLLLGVASLFLAILPELVWLSFLCAEMLTLLAALLLYRQVKRRCIDKL